MRALLMWLVVGSALAAGRPEPRMVRLEGSFFGAEFDTPMRIEVRPPTAATAPAVMASAERELRNVASWIEASATDVGLDDYARLRLSVAAVDALPVRVVRGGKVQRSPSIALTDGVWTATERMLAIGGLLRAQGYGVRTFGNEQREVFVGLRAADEGLNVNSVTQTWAVTQDGARSQLRVTWMLWDGRQRLGRLGGGEQALRGLAMLAAGAPDGRSFSFFERSVPAFALKRRVPATLQLHGLDLSVPYTRRPDLAAYLELFPEFHFGWQIKLARQEVEWLELGRGLREVTRRAPDEVALIDTLIRTLQASFVYEPGPLRSMVEIVESKKGDCDQLSMLLAVSLMEIGYTSEDIVAVSWPDHLGIAVRAQKGPGPDGSTGVDLQGGRYHLVDVTHYVYVDGKLASRWGQASSEHGRRVTVVELDRAVR